MSETLKKAIIAHKSGEVVELAAVNAGSDKNKSFDVFGKGSNQGSLEKGLLVPNGETLIAEDKPFAAGIIPGLTRIWLTKKDDSIFYDYTVHVQGGCPKGKWDNKLVFQDESGDRYTLRIFSSSDKEHTVNYHSTAGNIVKITWDI